MTSLTEAYDGGVGAVAGRRRRALGAGLFLAGAALVVGAIPLATTDLPAALGLGVFEARELAGVLAGLGVPAVFVGIFSVLPAGRATRGAAAIGASLAVLGVALFAAAYPDRWVSEAPAMAVTILLLYSTGTLVTFWCLFVGVATFNTRGAPGGSARVEITDEGTIRLVEGEKRRRGLGGIGLFGTDPDGDVDTQTSDGSEEMVVPEPTVDPTDPGGDPGRPGPGPEPAGDGGSAVADPGDAADEVVEAIDRRGRPDAYCGNCTHFEYVRADDQIAPYCGFHEELLEDMDACEQWTQSG